MTWRGSELDSVQLVSPSLDFAPAQSELMNQNYSANDLVAPRFARRSFVSFPDNQDVLDLIQAKPHGILPMLDDECRLPKGSDAKWVGRLYQHYGDKGHKRFSASAKNKRDKVFVLEHFAGRVEYEAETGFMEKNKDEMPAAAASVFKPENGARDFVAKLFDDTAAGEGKKKKGTTVGGQFKENLNNLLKKISATGPHYIRCLKPNDEALPSVLVRKRVLEQLKYGGVLEAVRVARSGFPVRFDHAAFYARFRVLLRKRLAEGPRGVEDAPAQKDCVEMLDELTAEDLEQLGGGSGKVSDTVAGLVLCEFLPPTSLTCRIAPR